MKNRLPVFLMTLVSEPRKFLHQRFGFANHHSGKNARPKPFKEFFVAANVTAVQQRDIKLNVIAVKFSTFGERSRGWAYAEVQIPQGLAKWRNGFPAKKILIPFLIVK